HGPVILGIFLTSNKKAPLTRAGPFKLTAKSQQLTAVLSTYLPCRRRVRRRRPELSSLPVSRLPALLWSASTTRSSPRWSAPSAPLSSDPARPPSRDLHSRRSARCTRSCCPSSR